MTITNQDFTMWQGDRKDVIITVRDLNGDILDITDSTVIWMMINATNKLSKSTALGGIILSDPENGELTIRIMPADTLEFDGMYFYHETEMTDAFGNISTVSVGNVALRKAFIPAYLETA